MKITHVIAIIVIAVAIGIIVSTAGDASMYVNFNQAYQMASSGDDKSIHVVGELKKDATGNILGLVNGADNVSCSFLLVDDQGKEQQVFYNEPMPQDLKSAEKVVVVGNYKGDKFLANKILLKCPSKYQEQKLNASI